MTLFWVVPLAAARLRHDLGLVACIPAVFVAMVMGFSLGVYAWSAFGAVPSVASPIVAWFAARAMARRYPPRAFLLAIYLVWGAALIFALIAVNFPDSPP